MRSQNLKNMLFGSAAMTWYSHGFSWILISLEPEIADSVLSCDTLHAIWEELRERFSLGNAPRIFQVQSDIYKMNKGSSLSQHIIQN